MDALLQLVARHARLRDGTGRARHGRHARPSSSQGDVVVATTYSGDTPVIRSTAKIGTPAVTASGQLSYITEIGGRLVDGIYPWIATLVDPWEVTSLEFLEPDSSVYALRPSSPLEVTWGFYSPNASFCYPGGEYAVVLDQPRTRR